MLKKLINLLFYNEKREFIQKNALMMTYIGLLQFIITLTDFFRGRYQSIIADIPVLSIMLIGWVLIKKYKFYPSNLAFVTAVPALSWLLYDSVEHNGMIFGMVISWYYFYCIIFYQLEVFWSRRSLAYLFSFGDGCLLFCCYLF